MFYCVNTTGGARRSPQCSGTHEKGRAVSRRSSNRRRKLAAVDALPVKAQMRIQQLRAAEQTHGHGLGNEAIARKRKVSVRSISGSAGKVCDMAGKSDSLTHWSLVCGVPWPGWPESCLAGQAHPEFHISPPLIFTTAEPEPEHKFPENHVPGCRGKPMELCVIPSYVKVKKVTFSFWISTQLRDHTFKLDWLLFSLLTCTMLEM